MASDPKSDASANSAISALFFLLFDAVDGDSFHKVVPDHYDKCYNYLSYKGEEKCFHIKHVKSKEHQYLCDAEADDA